VRKADSRRKTAREDRAARKEEEKAAKMEELHRLKNLKREAILDRLRQIQGVSARSVSCISCVLAGLRKHNDEAKNQRQAYV
jgi:hypothetical protein